jgi:hypothetical protein
MITLPLRKTKRQDKKNFDLIELRWKQNYYLLKGKK